MTNEERLEEIRARLAAIPFDDQKWKNITAFAIDAPLLDDERFAPQLSLILNAPADIRFLLDLLEECKQAALELNDLARHGGY